MGKFCNQCGNEINSNETFCSNCGNNVNNTTINNNKGFNIENRSIVTCVILSLLTCGIYGLIWFCSITDDINKVNEDNNATSGILALLLSIITCNIYFIYWSYKMGKNLYEIGQKNGKNIADNSIIYLVLAIFNFGLVNYCLMQNDLNLLSER